LKKIFLVGLIMKQEEIIGKTDDELDCDGMGDWFFSVVGESCLYNMAIVEYVPDGGNAKVRYIHWNQFTRKT
jgi:hypothetical protein